MTVSKTLGKIIGHFFFIFYPCGFAEKLGYFRNKIYTYWIAPSFKTLDDSSILFYPIVHRGEKYISIGKNTFIGRRTALTAWDKYEGDSFSPQIIIGNNVNIGDDCHITSINKIEIGDDVLMGKKITITDNSHGASTFESMSIPPIKRKLLSKGSVIIDSKVWIGDKVTILAGVKVGCCAIIGANSVVTSDIPEYSVAVGNPARVVKKIERNI